MDLESRLKEAFETDSVQVIAKKLNKSYQAIDHYLKGRRKLPVDLLVEISRSTNCSIHWLLTGEGPKQIMDAEGKKVQNIADRYTKPKGNYVLLNEELKTVISQVAQQEGKKLEDAMDELLLEALEARGEIETSPSTILRYEYFGEHKEKLVPIKLLGEIAAGKPIKVFEEEEIVYIAEDLVIDERSYVLRVRGDSMVDEGILDGDLIVCLATPKAYNGQRVVALIDNESATLKRFYQTGNLVRLVPANPMYKPMILPASRVTIQGVVTGIHRRML